MEAELTQAHIKWEYLEHPAFFARQATAFHFLRNCSNVIELGAYRTGMCSLFLRNRQNYQGVDPRSPTNNPFYIKERFPTDRLTVPPEYGLVLLGMDMELDGEGKEELFRLIEGAEKTVIEFPPAHQPSCDQFTEILSKTGKKVTVTVKFDFSANEFKLKASAPLMAQRNLYVLEGKKDEV